MFRKDEPFHKSQNEKEVTSDIEKRKNRREKQSK